jgi:hypothetical protein
MAETKEDAKAFMTRLQAARLGCGMCSAAVRVPPAGEPFSSGPFIGRYWCGDCWTLYWDDHPDHLADEESRTYVREDAKRIRVRRGSKVLYEEGESRVYRTSKGTYVFDLRTGKDLAQNEVDAAGLEILIRALKVVQTPVEQVQPASAI